MRIMPPDEVIRRLTDDLNPPPRRFGERLPLVGWITGDAFEVERNVRYSAWQSSGFKAKGRIVPGQAGANVELRLIPRANIWVFFTIWLLVTGAFAVGTFVSYLRGSPFGQEAWPIALLLLGLGTLIVLMTCAIEAGRIGYHVRRILGLL
jgi:hypothetical protein